MSSGQPKLKRNKSFTGCWTCRSRKVKCDTEKPHCNRCKKAGLTCEGYDIKLRWSAPIKYDLTGTQMAVPQEEVTFFQRRNVAFVKFPRLLTYDTYEAIDKDLALLHSPDVVGDETVLRGPFGTFVGDEEARKKRRKKGKKKGGYWKETAVGNGAGYEGDLFKNYGKGVAELAASGEQMFQRTGAAGYGQQALQQAPQQQYVEMQPPGYFQNRFSNWPMAKDNFNSQLRPQAAYAYGETGEQKTVADVRSLSEIQSIYNINSSGDNQKKDSQFIKIIQLPDAAIEYMPAGTKGVSNTAMITLPMTRFLLKNYLDNVADSMTVLLFSRNPWKTIYVPRAFKALGDLCAIGESSYSNHCTLNAILAVSAFHLRNSFARGSAGYVYWRRIAESARTIALDFINRSIEENLYSQKYKDVLVSILLMSTIDVLSGTMKLCKPYLELCQEFIQNRMKKNKKLSAKAKTLHRIFSFTKKVQESTQIFDIYTDKKFDLDENPGETIQRRFLPYINQPRKSVDDDGLTPRTEPLASWQSYNSNLFLQSNTLNKQEFKSVENQATFREKITDKGRISIEHIVNSNRGSPVMAPQSPKFIEVASQNFAMSPKYNGSSGANLATKLQEERSKSFSKSGDAIFSTDALFGLPNSLLLLFSEVVDLFQKKILIMDNVSIFGDSELYSFGLRIQEFERRLNSWQLEWNLWKSDSQDEFQSKVHEAVYHHLMSFSMGINVYFYRIIQRVKYMDVDVYVKNCLYHLQELQNLIDDNQAEIFPIFWQGFIAGSETTDPVLQKGFLEWCEQTSRRGVNDYHSAVSCLCKIWETKKLFNDDTITWIQIMKDYDISLMLT